MATYQTNFSEYSVGAQPSDWTARWGTTNNTWAVRTKTGAEGNQTLEQTSTADARRLLSWDDIDADANRADVEILARVRTTAGTIEQFRLIARASGAAAAENAYFFGFNGSSGLYLNKYVAGVSSLIGTPVAISWSTNTWYWMRFRVIGTDLFGKWWPDGEEEPSAWIVTGTDSDIASAGWVGVGVFESDGTKDFDYVSVGTNGDSAPLTNIADTSAARLSQLVAEALSTKANVAARLSQETVEVLSTTDPAARLTQVVVETLTPAASGSAGPSMIFIAT